MSNTFKVIDMITKEAQKIAHESTSFLKNVNMQYDGEFGKTGQKQGNTLRIREPVEFLVTSGQRVADVQDITESSQTLTVATQDHVAMNMTSAELTMDIDYISERYVRPAVKRLVANMEYNALTQFIKDTNQVVGAGTYSLAGGYAPGTALTDLAAPGRAQAMLNLQCAPTYDRCLIANSDSMATMVNGLKGLFQDSEQIKKQYNEGMMGRTSMADWYANEKVWTLTNVADVAGEINNGTLSSGITTLTVDGFTTIGGEGSVFTVENIFDVHPETKQSTGKLKQFVVTAGTTTTSLKFLPAMIYDTTNPKQNCSGTPVDGADITFYGSASTSYIQNIMFQKDAFTFVSAPMPVYGSAEECRNTNSDGDDSRINLRVWKQPDIINDRLILRIDALYGYKTIRPAWACRISA
jgi:hypothetical protein